MNAAALLGLECGSKYDSKCRAKADAESNSKADIAECRAKRCTKRNTHAHTYGQSDGGLVRRRLLGRIALMGARFNCHWGGILPLDFASRLYKDGTSRSEPSD